MGNTRQVIIHKIWFVKRDVFLTLSDASLGPNRKVASKIDS